MFCPPEVSMAVSKLLALMRYRAVTQSLIAPTLCFSSAVFHPSKTLPYRKEYRRFARVSGLSVAGPMFASYSVAGGFQVQTTLSHGASHNTCHPPTDGRINIEFIGTIAMDLLSLGTNFRKKTPAVPRKSPFAITVP
jgi:hypothetical protein